MGFSPISPDIQKDESMQQYQRRVVRTFLKTVAWTVCWILMTFLILAPILMCLPYLFSKPSGLTLGIITVASGTAAIALGAMCAKYIFRKL